MKSSGIRDYLMFMEAWVLLHLSRLSILILPFKKLASILGRSQQETAYDADHEKVATDIFHSVRRSARFTIHASKCYDQALTGKLMLSYRKVSSTIYFGLAKDQDSGLSAHAWLRAGSIIVTGKRAMHKFTPVAWFGR
jgi:hypothetical protein